MSDPSRSVARAYGVVRAGLFTMRHTVYIDPAGQVLHVDRAVKPATAGADLAAHLDRLGVRKVSP